MAGSGSVPSGRGTSGHDHASDVSGDSDFDDALHPWAGRRGTPSRAARDR
jgi:hypothetical protein